MVKLKTNPMKHSFFNTKALLLFTFIAGVNHLTLAQQKPLQNWNSIGLTVPTGKKVDFSFSELASFIPVNGYSLAFAQTSAAI